MTRVYGIQLCLASACGALGWGLHRVFVLDPATTLARAICSLRAGDNDHDPPADELTRRGAGLTSSDVVMSV